MLYYVSVGVQTRKGGIDVKHSFPVDVPGSDNTANLRHEVYMYYQNKYKGFSVSVNPIETVEIFESKIKEEKPNEPVGQKINQYYFCSPKIVKRLSELNSDFSEKAVMINDQINELKCLVKEKIEKEKNPIFRNVEDFEIDRTWLTVSYRYRYKDGFSPETFIG